MTYRELLEAIEEAQARKAFVERCAEEVYRCRHSPAEVMDKAEGRLNTARRRFDEEIGS